MLVEIERRDVLLIDYATRWEDYEYTYLRPENRFAYFGNVSSDESLCAAVSETNFVGLDQTREELRL
jgi:hypothetical protein